jgi:hypothetical protein
MSFESIINKIPKESDRANILYNLEKLSSEELKQEYKDFVVKSFKQSGENNQHLFFKGFYNDILLEVYRRASYAKHDFVVRQGTKCKFCKGQNTISQDNPNAGGDEYIPTKVKCYDCNKEYLF